MQFYLQVSDRQMFECWIYKNCLLILPSMKILHPTVSCNMTTFIILADIGPNSAKSTLPWQSTYFGTQYTFCGVSAQLFHPLCQSFHSIM
jgi:hypothetical protein